MSRRHIIHDLSFLCSMCTRTEYSFSQLSIMACLLRGEDEAVDIAERTGMHVISVGRILNSMRIAGEVSYYQKKQLKRRVVNSWKLTFKGLRAIIRFERAYREYTEKRMNSTLLRTRKIF